MKARSSLGVAAGVNASAPCSTRTAKESVWPGAGPSSSSTTRLYSAGMAAHGPAGAGVPSSWGPMSLLPGGVGRRCGPEAFQHGGGGLLRGQLAAPPAVEQRLQGRVAAALGGGEARGERLL